MVANKGVVGGQKEEEKEVVATQAMPGHPKEGLDEEKNKKK
jgi:hypothetical protein